MKRNILIFISCLLLLGCSKVEEKSLIGKYFYKPYPNDVIYVYKNHTYSHQYTNSKGTVFKVDGKWVYNGRQIDFHDFNFFNDLGPAFGSGIWATRVEESDDKIKLIYASDVQNGYFEKE